VQPTGPPLGRKLPNALPIIAVRPNSRPSRHLHRGGMLANSRIGWRCSCWICPGLLSVVREVCPMPRKALYPATQPWQNRYRTPAPADLIASLESAAAELFLHVRSGLTIQAELRETLAWHGIPWRWSFRYTCASVALPVAYLVPQPDRAFLVLPLPAEGDPEAVDHKCSRHVRDAIALTPAVGGVRWTHWPLCSRLQSDELISLACRIAKRAAILRAS
jgi:hypothetical protein